MRKAAERLGVSEPRVRQLLASGDLAGRRLGRTWLVSAESVARTRERGARLAAAAPGDISSGADVAQFAYHYLAAGPGGDPARPSAMHVRPPTDRCDVLAGLNHPCPRRAEKSACRHAPSRQGQVRDGGRYWI